MSEEAGKWVTATIGRTGFRVDVTARSHTLIGDEPVDVKGTDLGPTPYEYLLTAIGTCTVMTLRLYADRKGFPMESASVMLRSGQSHERDCENCEKQKVGISRVERRIEFQGALTDEQRSRLVEIADRCPLKQTIERGIKVETIS